MKKTFYTLLLSIIISLTSGLYGQEKLNDVNRVPLVANCENGNTRSGRVGCIRNAIGGIVKYIDIDKVVHEDFRARIYVRLKLEISEIGDISLKNVVHDNNKIKRIIKKAFKIWKKRNEDIVIKPARKDGKNISVSLVFPLVFYGAEY